MVLMDPSRMPAENPLYSDVANAGFKSADKMLAKVDMGALQDQANEARMKEDENFADLVREKREAGRLAKGAKFLVAKFALQSDERFKKVKKRAEELYKAILRRDKEAEGGTGGANGGTFPTAQSSGRRRAMPPPPYDPTLQQQQQQQQHKNQNLEPFGYVMGGTSTRRTTPGVTTPLMGTLHQQQQQPMMMMMMPTMQQQYQQQHQTTQMMQQRPHYSAGGYGYDYRMPPYGAGVGPPPAPAPPPLAPAAPTVPPPGPPTAPPPPPPAPPPARDLGLADDTSITRSRQDDRAASHSPPKKRTRTQAEREREREREHTPG